MRRLRRRPRKPARRNSRDKSQTRRSWLGLTEYSKQVLAAMIILWFAGALFGAVVVVVQLCRKDYAVSIDSLLNYIGLPMGGGIVGYLVKSAIENNQKFKQAFDPNHNRAE